MVQQKKALLLVTNANFPLGIIGVAMLGTDPIFLLAHGAVKDHAAHVHVLSLRGTRRRRLTASTARLGPATAFFRLLSLSGNFHSKLLQTMFEGGNVGVCFK